EGFKAAATLRDAVITILVADFVMSTDNVLGVAGASQGNVGLLLFGLIFSMAILMWMGNVVADLINRFIWLSYVAVALLPSPAASMPLKHPFWRRTPWGSP